jgi:hypothetical protein
MSKYSLSKTTPKVNEEAAQASLMELLEFYRVDVDDIEDAAQKGGAESILNKLKGAYMRGAIENLRDDKGFQIVQHLEAPPADVKAITYSELKGIHKLAMDGYKETETVHRQHALLGSLSGLGAPAIKTLAACDLSVAECLAFVFFSA